jgi:hypothetical protein
MVAGGRKFPPFTILEDIALEVDAALEVRLSFCVMDPLGEGGFETFVDELPLFRILFKKLRVDGTEFELERVAEDDCCCCCCGVEDSSAMADFMDADTCVTGTEGEDEDRALILEKNFGGGRGETGFDEGEDVDVDGDRLSLTTGDSVESLEFDESTTSKYLLFNPIKKRGKV